MNQNVPPRIAGILINALKGGVVPRTGLEYITVGRKQEIEAILHDIDLIQDGGSAFRFIVGRYGSGKSFLLQTIRNYAMSRGFAVMDADLSPERRFYGTKGEGTATYRELIKNLSTKTRPDGGALSLILEKWISGIQTSLMASGADSKNLDSLVEQKIYEVAGSLEGMINGFEFAKAVVLYWQAYREDDQAKKSKVIKWFRGEYPNRTEAKKDLGISFIVNDENWYDFLKLFASFLVGAGYNGLLVMIDELVNISKIARAATRDKNYEKMLTMYNDVLQGKARYLGFFMGGTPQCIEDPYRGVFSYEALRSRLQEGHFSTEELRDLSAPIIRLSMLSPEEMYILVEKLMNIHAGLYHYEPFLTHDDLLYFLTVEYNRVGADSHITPREIIRDFIELIDILHQNPGKTVSEILGSNSFEMAKGAKEEEIDSEFAEFDL